jgi:hypothetical protein
MDRTQLGKAISEMMGDIEKTRHEARSKLDDVDSETLGFALTNLAKLYLDGIDEYLKANADQLTPREARICEAICFAIAAHTSRADVNHLLHMRDHDRGIV